MNEYKTDVLIIGGGPVGMFASFMCGMVGLKSAIVDSFYELGGQCTQLYPDKPIFDIAGLPRIIAKDLVNNLKKQMDRFDVDIYLNESVTKFDPSRIGLTKVSVSYKSLILASGSGVTKPNKPKLPNIDALESKGLVKYVLNNIEIFRDKTVVVGGGGDSAIDWCISLKDVAKKIYIIHRRNSFRAMSSLQEELRQIDSCEILLSTEIDKIIESNNKLRFVCSHNENYIDADYFVPCYGVQSDSSFLEGLNLEMNAENKIIVDPTTCLSSKQKIYAIGDACSYKNKRNLIVCGFGEAANAAYHISEELCGPKAFEFSTSRFV